MQPVSNDNRSTYIVQQSLEHIAKAREQQETQNEAAKAQEIKNFEERKENIEDIANSDKSILFKLGQESRTDVLKQNMRYSDINKLPVRDNAKIKAYLLYENKSGPTETEANEVRGDTEIRAYNLDEYKRGPVETKANTATGAAEKNENKTVDTTKVNINKIGYDALNKMSHIEERKTTDKINVDINKKGNLAEKIAAQSNQAREMDAVNRSINIYKTIIDDPALQIARNIDKVA